MSSPEARASHFGASAVLQLRVATADLHAGANCELNSCLTLARTYPGSAYAAIFVLICWHYITEFKEIRKEWKAKKKEEENQRKQEEERQRQEAARNGQDTSQPQGQPGQYQQHMMAPQMGGPQLPPIGYQPAGGQAPAQYAQPQQVDGAQQYSNGSQMYGAQGYPQSPYAQGGLQYQQRT
jgi:hypothetical protein